MQELLKQAEVLVINFTQEMNDWESKMYLLDEYNDGKTLSTDQQKLIENETEKSLNELYYRLIKKILH